MTRRVVREDLGEHLPHSRRALRVRQAEGVRAHNAKWLRPCIFCGQSGEDKVSHYVRFSPLAGPEQEEEEAGYLLDIFFGKGEGRDG